MTGFNHDALGAVADWIHRVVGVEVDIASALSGRVERVGVVGTMAPPTVGR